MYNLNLEQIKDFEYKIISLGCNCIPRTVLTRWGLKPSKKQGELTMPFDLATFETFEITNLIQNNFDTLFDNIVFKKKSNILDKSYWLKAPDCIEFVHEKNLGKNDKAKLIEIYKKRVENFNNTINQDVPILFVQLIGDCDDSSRLYNELKKIRQGKPFKFVLIDPYKISNEKNSDISVLQLPYPGKYYHKHWWLKHFYNSTKGKAFEYKIADFCLENLKELKKQS